MDTPGHELMVLLLCATAALQAAALLFVLVWNARARQRIGPVLHQVRRRTRWRWAFLAGIAALLAACFLVDSSLPAAPAAAVLALAGALVALQPGFADSHAGERGVQVGWHARRFEELEEWRLSGDHLRWRLGELWIASDAPAELHPRLRALLEALAPQRESRFKR